MDPSELTRLAEAFLGGRLSADQFRIQFFQQAAAWMEGLTLDVDRRWRCGFPEVVFGEGKSLETMRRICQEFRRRGSPLLATRVEASMAERLLGEIPQAVYHPLARTLRVDHWSAGDRGSAEAPAAGTHTAKAPDTAAGPTAEEPAEPPFPAAGPVAVISAGATDRAVAEEARQTLDWMGVTRVDLDDIGVAGPQRLMAHLDALREVDAVVVVAGMEGALPSVVGGLVPCPVIAVPTSVGYGANLAGLTPLLGMLSSCAANVTVVNIDAGFKGGYVAGLIAHNRVRPRAGPSDSEASRKP